MRAVLRRIPLLRAVHHRLLRMSLDIEGWMAIRNMRHLCPNKVNAEAKIAITLTTYGARLNGFAHVLDALIRQEFPHEYGVIVHLSNSDVTACTLPASLRRFEQAGVKFVYHEENLRSYKKLVYEYGRERDRVLITADDDVIYPPTWLSSLHKAHINNPSCIVAYRAHQLRPLGQFSFPPYKEMMRDNGGLLSRTNPSFALMPTGVSGVLYPPDSLDPIAVQKDLFLLHAPTGDDIWFKIASLRKGTKCVQVEERNRSFPFVPGSQAAGALHEENIGNSRNDAQLADCFSNFQDAYARLLEELVANNDNYRND